MSIKEVKRAYLRSLRINSGINQGDLRDLLGFKNHASVSKIENCSRDMSLADAVSYHLIFSVPLSHLLYTYIRRYRLVILERAKKINQILKSRDAPEDNERQAFITELTARLNKSPNHKTHE